MIGVKDLFNFPNLKVVWIHKKGLKMVKKILYYVFGAIFLLGIALSFISMWLHPRNSEDMNYEELQPELFTHEDISAVLIRDDLQQIYVCYNDAAHVNTYNASGEFLWAVATPYSGNVDFVLLENNLVIDGSEYAYIYNADGTVKQAYKGGKRRLRAPFLANVRIFFWEALRPVKSLKAVAKHPNLTLA